MELRVNVTTFAVRKVKKYQLWSKTGSIFQIEMSIIGELKRA